LKYTLQNNKMQQTRHHLNGASLLILVFCGRSDWPAMTIRSLGIAILSLAMTACVMDSIQQSYIEGNAPPPEEFHRVLQRDLDAYFATALSPSRHVQYEMLREGATQSGVSYPKFYVWAIFPLIEGDRRGAVRLAAIDKERFEVTDFISDDEIKRHPDRIYETFPRPVCERIKAKVGIK
jgi:hypothetical protein